MKESLGHYDIVSELGRGGMGVVYKGYEPALTRYVAIKELSPALAHDAHLVERFLREARSMAALNDPHIIQIHFIGQENNQPFFAMEFVEGESLSHLIRREGRLPIADVLKILLQTARGLQTAHERGVIHRDIKPANLMLDLRGRIKIADFGIALARQEFDAKLTGTGEFVGTPGYLSPEICLGKAVDARSDLFALGIVMFESLTGRLPFSDESPLKLMLDVVQAEIPDIRAINQDVDVDTAAILTKLVAKDPSDRYQSAADLIADLERHPLVAGRPTALGTPIRKPAGAAATMYTAPPTTPTAKRPPTPPPVVGPPPKAASEPPTLLAGVTPPAPSDAAPARRAPSKAPMVVAALLGVGVLGAAALGGWRMFGPGATGEGAAAGEASVDAASRVDTAAASTPALADAGLPPTGDAAIPPAGGTALPPTSGSDGIGGEPAASGADSSGALGPALAVGAAAASGTVAAKEGASGAVVPTESTSTTVDAIARNDSGGAPLAERREARREAREQRRAAVRAATTVAVVGSGDPAIVIPVVQAIEDRASAAGWQLTENPDGADRVIRVNFDQTGTQQLQYYGRTSEMVIGQLSVRAFGAAGGALGPGFRSRVEYTALNAEAKADEAIRGQVDGVVGAPGAQ